MKKVTIALAFLLSLSSIEVFAQFTLSGQFRPRTELRNGFKKPTLEGDAPALFTEQRSRLIGTYKSEKFSTKLSIQDVRIWGETGQINKTDGLLSVHEAYGDYHFSKSTTLRIGRQELVYDDHRVLGSLGWAAQARSHDAVRLMVKDSLGEFHAGLTWNQDNAPAEPAKLQGTNANAYTTAAGAYANGQINTIFQLGNPKSTQYLWYKRMFGAGQVTALVLNDIVQTTDSTTHARTLLGVNPTIKAGGVKFAGSFYYQFGQKSDDVDFGGMLAHLDVIFTGLDKVTPLIGFDYLSGDDKTTTDKIEGFNPLYGTHHKFYGLMDYFYVGNGHNGGGNENSGGLVDIYAKSTFKVGEKSKFLTHLHYFMSPTDVTSTVDASDASTGLGAELDLVFVHPMTKGVVMKAGYSQLFATESMSFIKGQLPDATSGFNAWAWVMIDFTPKFL